MPGEKNKIQLVIVDDIANTRDNISHLLEFESDIEVIASVGSAAEAIERCQKLDPDVVLMDINMPEMDGIKATELIRTNNSVVQVIMLTVQGEISYMRKAMLAGARDYLTKPPEPDELISTIRRAADFAKEERVKRQAARNAILAEKQGDEQHPGHLVMVYSPKGGTGVTTVCVNLACALQKQRGKTLLIDANLQYGDVPMFLNQNSRYNLLDLTSRADQLDSEVIEELTMVHTASELRVIPSPPRFEQAEQIQSEQLGNVIERLLTEFETIIVDTPRVINEHFLTLLDHTSIIIVPITQDLPAIRDAQLFIDLLRSLNFNLDHVVLILNKSDKRISISAARISKNLKVPIDHEIELDEKTVLNSVNRGIPFYLEETPNVLKGQIEGIAEKVSKMLDEAVLMDMEIE